MFQIRQFVGMILPAPFSLRCGLLDVGWTQGLLQLQRWQNSLCVKGESIKALCNVHQNGFLILGCVLYNIMPVKAPF